MLDEAIGKQQQISCGADRRIIELACQALEPMAINRLNIIVQQEDEVVPGGMDANVAGTGKVESSGKLYPTDKA
ncbi:hypothetical protein D9M68_867560 [compost metagenome]